MTCAPKNRPRALPRVLAVIAVFVASFNLTACVSVKTEHRVEPIQITLDVNVRLERELEESFGELDALSREIASEQSDNQSIKEAE